jgi:hypothetical protein
MAWRPSTTRCLSAPGRLRRTVPAHVEMGRLGEDGFLLLMRNCHDSGDLIHLARRVQEALPVLWCSTPPWSGHCGPPADALGGRSRRGRAAGVQNDARAASAVGIGRGMSRAALGYPSRIAWFDETSGEIVDMPVLAD